MNMCSGYECSYCHRKVPWQEEINERPKHIDGKRVCNDCYFDELGKMIDECPIGIFPPRH